jgi:EAL domain-containing protein (putative c-di-GMP-specific phosphodiesterase class I)/DNA-binding SARP family transcriptional activator/DNA-binding NarL/FixJ family response regulator
MRVVLLGGLTIERGGTSHNGVGLPGGRAELVFAYLAAEHRRIVSRDELADALWPELLPDTWAPALRGVVTDVRRFLVNAGLDPADVLLSQSSGYRLRLPDDAVLDLDETRDGLAGARELLEAGDAPGAATVAERAADLAALPFLPQHDGEWVDGIRDELRTIATAALELLARAHAQAGSVRAAIAAAERLVHAEPYSEAAHRLLMGVLVDTGDRPGAVDAYDECRAMLEQELGVMPSDETEAVLARALGPAAVTVAPHPQAAPATARTNDDENPLARYAVLVVEDHAFQRRTALKLLRGLGVGTLSEAADGNAALELLAASAPPDVIICDLEMPGMDGVEFIRRVAERGLASAVVIASGLDRRVLKAVQSVSEGYGLQVLGAVEKPLTARRLTELLAAYRPPHRPGNGEVAPAVSERMLAEALERNALTAVLRPIADLASGAISAAEVLARWPAPIPATADVLGLLEAQQLTERFVDRLVVLLCEELDALDRAGRPIDLWMAIPDAALADVALAGRVADRVRANGAEPRRIVWTFGPRALRPDTPGVLHVLTRLRVMGFGLCLDDFGSGPRSSEQLDRVPLTALRLAAHLVGDAQGDPARVPELQDAVDAAHEFGLPVVGDGCATAADFELLLALGCTHAQGACISEPMAAAQLPAWAARWSPPAED